MNYYSAAAQQERDAATAARANRTMTGHTLITLVTEAESERQAIEIAKAAPASALRQAADLLYVDSTGHSKSFTVKAIVREARS